MPNYIFTQTENLQAEESNLWPTHTLAEDHQKVDIRASDESQRYIGSTVGIHNRNVLIENCLAFLHGVTKSLD